jgi:hypothetical protein
LRLIPRNSLEIAEVILSGVMQPFRQGAEVRRTVLAEGGARSRPGLAAVARGRAGFRRRAPQTPPAPANRGDLRLAGEALLAGHYRGSRSIARPLPARAQGALGTPSPGAGPFSRSDSREERVYRS